MAPLPKVIFLDQNKWIDLLKAEASPNTYPRQFSVLKKLEAGLCTHAIVLPLSETNIYETFKIGDPERRAKLARLQARLSGGMVFRGRRARLEGEFRDFLRITFELPIPPNPEWWFLSDLYFEAFFDLGDSRVQHSPSPEQIETIKQNPAAAIFHYLVATPDNKRLVAVKRWSDESNKLRAQIEEQRHRQKDQSFSMRKRIYSARLAIQELPLLAQIASEYGVHWNSVNDIGDSMMRRIFNELPIYFAERELAARLESENRAVNENDFRDVDAYCSALVYADVLIGENLLVNLARQGGLGKKFNTTIETSILALNDQ